MIDGVLCDICIIPGIHTWYYTWYSCVLYLSTQAMEPLMLKLRRLFRIKIRRYMVWEGTASFRYMTALDEEFQCK